MSDVNKANPTSFADSLRGFAAMIRSGAMTADDHEMVAKKFVAAADVLDERTALLAKMAEALKALRIVSEVSSKPRKLDEALTWIENDKLATNMADEALAEYEAGKESSQ